MAQCIGCTLEIGPAPEHQMVLDAEHTRVSWHIDCHALTTACVSCQAIVTAYPGLKDAALGQAILTSNPNPPVTEG